MSGRRMRSGISQALLAALLIGFANMMPVHADDGKAQRRTVSVSASGSYSAEPDQALITLGVSSDAQTAREALKANSARMTEIIDSLKSAGLAAKDIQTANFSIEPRYQHFKDGRPPKVVGYRVSNQVRITVREIPKLGGVLDKVVDLGANQIGGIAFSVSNQEQLKDEARREAMANARRRADLYAKASGAELGEVLTISETVFGGTPRPMPMARSAMAADAVPIEAGSQELTVNVHVTWALK